MTSLLTQNDFTSLGEKIYDEKQLQFSLKLAEFIKLLHLDESSIIIALLMHSDINNPNKIELIRKYFKNDFIEQIELLQRIGNVSFPDTSKKIHNVRRLFIELTTDLRIIFVKLAERLLKLKDSDAMNASNVLRLSEECLYLYSPIAHRLGIRRIYTDMEDIAFRRLFQEDYNRLNRAIEKNRLRYERKLMEMTADLQRKLKDNQINATLQSRVKRLYSIYLKTKNKGAGLDEIFDLMALRVITDNIENCYHTLGVVHRNWIPLEGRFRDWVSYPKANGYRSIQTTVLTRKGDKFEVQIRTQEMHKEAEYGSAAHWAYKEGVGTGNSWIMKLKEFLENDEYFENPYILLDKFKYETKREHINVLTPKGEIVSLPRDSTAIDFAYQIHTQLGNQITGARINGRFAKLKDKLNSGDVVEVISSKNAKPSRDWLNYVKTSKARSKILIWIKKNESEQIIFEGKRIWEKFKKTFKKKLEGYEDESKFKNNLNKIGYKSTDDFYSAIAIKSIKLSQSLLRKVYPEAFVKPEKKNNLGKFKRKESDLKPKITVEGLSNIETHLSKCCNPIKGEPIIAYITKNSKIKIHSTNCNYLKSDFFDFDRFKKAEWLDFDSMQTVRLKIFGYEVNEMLSLLIEKGSELSIGILKTEKIESHTNKAGLYIELEVKDIFHLRQFTDKLKSTRIIESLHII